MRHIGINIYLLNILYKQISTLGFKILIILIAPSGGGKSTIAGSILRDAENIDYSISYTTRSARGEEEHGKHYFFVQDADFDRLIAEDDLLEHATVHGYQYGTSRSFIQSRLAVGHHVIMDIDVQGACQIMEQHDIPFTAIFLVPPSMAELKTRLRERNREGEEELAGRLETAREELKQMHRFDFVVVNDELDRAVDVMKSIISAERHRVSRIRDLEQLNIQLIRED